MLDLRRLRLLHELHRLGTVGAVAQALSYSPSTVSQQLKVLEREAGTPLFEPAGRRVRLTDAALVLVEHAQRLLADAERAEADLAAAAAGAVAGVVRVGSFQTASLHLLLPAMNTLRDTHPGVRVRVVEAEPEAALEALRSHALDLALADEWAGTPHPRWPGTRPRGPVHRGRPARAPARPPESRARRPGGARGPGRRSVGDRLPGRRHVRAGPPRLQPARRLRAGRPARDQRADDAARARRAGHAVTLLPELALIDDPGGVAVRPVADAELTRTLFTAVRAGADRRPALAAVRAEIRRGSPSSRSGRSGT